MGFSWRSASRRSGKIQDEVQIRSTGPKNNNKHLIIKYLSWSLSVIHVKVGSFSKCMKFCFAVRTTRVARLQSRKGIHLLEGSEGNEVQAFGILNAAGMGLRFASKGTFITSRAVTKTRRFYCLGLGTQSHFLPCKTHLRLSPAISWVGACGRWARHIAVTKGS